MRNVGRLAPSPTGAQHVGNARTYLVAWLSARSRGGTVRLRLEDIDSPRIKPGSAEEALDDLRWLGLDWDGEILTQTERVPLYQVALGELSRREFVYPCTCSRGDIAAAASAPHADHEAPTYPGTCAYRSAADAAKLSEEGKPFAWRIRVTDSPAFNDLFAGEQNSDLHRLGDFVVWKNAGTPAYQLAVVVDDAEMGITEVIRGDDLIPSTPRQLLLYRALGLAPPAFANIPLVVEKTADGSRSGTATRGSPHSATRGETRSTRRVIGVVVRLAREARADLRSRVVDSVQTVSDSTAILHVDRGIVATNWVLRLAATRRRAILFTSTAPSHRDAPSKAAASPRPRCESR